MGWLVELSVLDSRSETPEQARAATVKYLREADDETLEAIVSVATVTQARSLMGHPL